MRQAMFELFKRLQTNSINQIVFYKNNKRQIKTFQDFSVDVDLCIRRINAIGSEIKNVALLGPISYEWMTLDFACIKGGFVSIAVPETLSSSAINDILFQCHADLILLDHSYKEKGIGSDLNLPTYYFRCDPNLHESLNFEIIEPLESVEDNSINKIQEIYSIAFSSGTSSNIKQIKVSFDSYEVKPTPWYLKLLLFKKIFQYKSLISYKRSFWSRLDNKLILFMPFSHLQQRLFVHRALFSRINIVLSDSVNCAKHIIMEKPNIMVSVPLIYEILAENIEKKIKQFKGKQLLFFKLYTVLGINNYSKSHPINNFFSEYLFKDVRKIYGGKADYFITGSAPIKKEALEVFHSVGVKILEAYGQSEIGVISMNSAKHFRLGSVGKPVVKVKISDQSEILVEYKESKYKNQKEILKVNDAGYIHTGDIGYLDNKGFLFVKGRLDDVIVLKNGKKIFPDAIDLKLTSFDQIKQAVTICKDDKLVAIVSLVSSSSKGDLKGILATVNKELQDYSQIHSYLIVPELSVENGLLTSTFKVKRKEVFTRFREESYEYINK